MRGARSIIAVARSAFCPRSRCRSRRFSRKPRCSIKRASIRRGTRSGLRSSFRFISPSAINCSRAPTTKFCAGTDAPRPAGASR
ncbi:MAG: CRISPR-associated protein Cas5 [Chloroflexi bacterium]|nr:CRISPR-associated protein Cas5 [Chloroflexota bacterium]